MSDLNHIEIKGFITKDVEIKASKNGVKYARFRIGSNHWNKSQQKNVGEFFNVIAYGHDTDVLKLNGKKGQGIIVTGRLTSQVWKDKNDTNHEVVTINASEIDYLKKVKLPTAGDDRQKTGLEVQKEKNTDSSESQANVENDASMDDPFADNQEDLDVSLKESDFPF